MSYLYRSLLSGLILSPLTLLAAYSGSSAPSVPSGAPSTITRPPPNQPPASPLHPLTPKPALPTMSAPFQMPGVVGWQNEKWVGSDFLGYLSNNISISVEIRKTPEVTTPISEEELQSMVAELFRKESINPQAEVKEGPPLPFLHILVMIYPVQKDRVVILCCPRLFEHVQIIRKDFIPAGFWQAITWESAEVDLVSEEQLDTQLKASVERAANAFIKRYWEYNRKTNLPK